MRFGFLSLPIVIALLSGCAATPKPVSDINRNVPDQFTTAAQPGAIDGRWWESFGDARIAYSRR